LSRITDFWLKLGEVQLLRLLVRLAFICNVCFLLAALILLVPNPPGGQIVSTVIVLGYVLGLPANAVVFGWAIVLASLGRWQEAEIPVWLTVVNCIVFCFQLFLLIIHWVT
jgi:hypothetical protein